MASKKQHEAFNKKVIKAITELGAKSDIRYPIKRVYQLPTKAGILNITLSEPHAGPVFSVFTRFDEVDRANTFLSSIGLRDYDFNVHSGKWNFHMSDGKTCYDTLIYCLKLII